MSQESLKKTFPRLAPFKKVGDYLTSIESQRKVQLPYFQWDKARTDPDLQLVLAKKAFTKTDEALKEKKIEYKKKRDLLDQQWKELEQLESSLKKTFTTMSSFVRSNEDKRSRATERKAEDSLLVTVRTKKIEETRAETDFFETSKQELDREIQRHMIFEHYLNKVVENFVDFTNPGDIIDRFEALNHTKSELAQRQSTNFAELETARSKMMKTADENNFHLLGMNNNLANLHARYQKAHNTAIHWERLVNAIKFNCLLKLKEVLEVKQACRNMYLKMSRRKSETFSRIEQDDFENQLIYIKHTLKQLAAVRLEAARASEMTFGSMKGAISKS